MNFSAKSVCAAVILLFATAVAAYGGDKIRVACVGNSITYGTGIDDRENMSYPVQLGRMLGDGYSVGNFGNPGSTLLNHGHKPYMKLPEWRAALDFKPDIVVVHLGINDTDPRNWTLYGDEFVGDYVALVDSFKAVNPDVRVILARLTPISATHRRFKTGTRDWREMISDAISDVAKVTGSELIDFGPVLRDRQNLMSDGIHPDAEGAGLMADCVRGAITGDYGGLKLPEIYSDGMVLQRYKPLTINGRADAGSNITVSIAGNVVTATADGRGHWAVTLPPMTEATGLKMSVTDGKRTLNFNDVAVGEVWLASGQSNMEFPLRESKTFIEDTLKANDSMLRLFNMKPRVHTKASEWSEEEKDSVDHLVYYRPAKWQSSTPESAQWFSAVGWYFGKMLRDSLDVPVGIICNAVGGVGTESWIDIESLEHSIPDALINWRKNDYIQPWVQQRAGENTGTSNPKRRHSYEPSYLFSAGIRPLGAYPIAGVIWYQGESNAHNTELHEQYFPLLINSWRHNWNEPELPFIYTQLSSLNRPSWPHFRDSQRRMLETSGATGMAVTSDVGDSLDVHPRDKRPVGDRLGRWALNRVYSMTNITPSGPLPVRAVVTAPGCVEIEMDYGVGMHSSDGSPLRTFEMTETDGLYQSASAEVIGNNRIKLTNMNIKQPKYIRYGWQPFTRANLVNSDNLPASTFKIEVSEADDSEQGIENGVSAAFAGMADGHILKAGGCNFPANPMAPGSVKKFYQAIYEIKTDDAGRIVTEKIGMLPEAMAYGAFVSTPEGLIIIGGTTQDKSLSTVYKINVNEAGQAEVTELPSLPVTIDNAPAALLDGKIYVAGGNVDGKPSNAIFRLDLAHLDKGWSRLKDFPGNPRVQPVMASSANSKGQPRLYLWGGFAGKGDNRPATLDTDGLEFNPEAGKWKQIPAPVAPSGETISTGGGVACTLPDGRIVVTGGVNKDIFLEALQNQAPDYLSHPIEWYRFNSFVLVFDPIKNEWKIAADDPETARAGAAAVVTSEGEVLLIGGELKPRIRTPRISSIVVE